MSAEAEAAMWAALRRPVQPWPQKSYVVGWDPAQAQDFSAVAVIEKARWPAEGADYSNIRLWASAYRTEYAVRHLERMLRLDYVRQTEHVHRLMNTAPLHRETLVVDQTGVGRPLLDLIRRSGLRPVGITFTGSEKSQRDGPMGWRVGKAELVGTLSSLLASGELKIASGLELADVLVQEALDFAVGYTGTGAMTFNASAGKHDDLLMATAIALWYAVTQGAVT